MPMTTAQRGGATRTVICTHCEQPNSVARRAMSVFCSSCRKRLILEDYRIDSYYAVRDFSTCGDIVVEKGGFVVAPIKVGNLTIKGKVQGQVIARGTVLIDKSGQCKGDIEAAGLIIEHGGSYDGRLRIGCAPPALETPEAPAPKPIQPSAKKKARPMSAAPETSTVVG